jgi:hypothetical protein
MRFTSLAVVGLLSLSSTVGVAEDVYVLRECSGFKTKTTEVDRLRLPDLPIKGEDANKFGAGVELGSEWLDERSFRDGQSRTWYHYRGAAPKAQGDKIAGWVVKSDGGREYFYTKDGQLYGPEAKVPICSPAQSKVTNVR